METTTKNKLGYINVKFYKEDNVLESEYPLHATIEEAERLCEKLGVTYQSDCELFTSQGKCLLTVRCDRTHLLSVCSIGGKRIDRLLLKRFLGEIFGHQLDQ